MQFLFLQDFDDEKGIAPFYLFIGKGEKMDYRIGVIAGDGIGPEITDAAWTVLEKVAEKYGAACIYLYSPPAGG